MAAAVAVRHAVGGGMLGRRYAGPRLQALRASAAAAAASRQRRARKTIRACDRIETIGGMMAARPFHDGGRMINSS